MSTVVTDFFNNKYDTPIFTTEQEPNNGVSQAMNDNTDSTNEMTDERDDKEKITESIHRDYPGFSCAELCKRRKLVTYLIKGYVREHGLGMIYGASGSGKTFCVLDMAVTIACPAIETWHGKPVKHAPVIYFAGEGADGLDARILCLCNERKINPETVQLTVIDKNFKLDDNNDKSHSIEKTISAIKHYHERPGLVIFDTLNMFLDGDENSNTDAGHFCSLCRKIINECDCSVLIIQHTGQSPDAKNRARGASAFRAAMDFELQLLKDGNVFTLSTPKQRDGKEQPELIFNLVEHVIPEWFDDDGEPVTCSTLELAEKLMQYRETLQAEKQKPKLKDSQEFALRTYKESAKEHGEIIVDNPDTGHTIVRVDVKDWRRIFHKLSTQDKQSARDKAFERARKYLAEKTTTLYIQRTITSDFYCLDLSSNNTNPEYRIEIQDAIKTRQATKPNDTDRTPELP